MTVLKQRKNIQFSGLLRSARNDRFGVIARPHSGRGNLGIFIHKRYNKLFLCASLMTTGLLLSGCDTMRNTFGLDHYQADEMQVNPNPRLAALTIPPNFQLRPPRPGAPNPNQTSADSTAKSALLGDQYTEEEDPEFSSPAATLASNKQKAKQKGASDAEAHLLGTAAAHAGTGDDEEIRSTIDAEAPQKKKST